MVLSLWMRKEKTYFNHGIFSNVTGQRSSHLCPKAIVGQGAFGVQKYAKHGYNNHKAYNLYNYGDMFIDFWNCTCGVVRVTHHFEVAV